MSSTALKTLAVILVVAAAVLGFVAYYFSQGLTQAPDTAERQPPQPGENQVLAVVATQRIAPYQPIPQEAVALMPISVQPPQYYTDVGEVVGRTPLRSVPVGAPVTEEVFGTANILAQAIPPGTQAMSLEISDVIAVGGFVRPGDMVDVLVYIRASGREVEQSQARVLLENARVLGYEERLINVDDEGAQDGDEGRQRRQRTAVLAVPQEDTTRVMLGASLGELRLALRGDGPRVQTARADAAAAEADGDAPEALAPTGQAAAGDAATAKKGQDGGQDAKEEQEQQKVITLRELAAIEDGRGDDADRPKPPPRAIIEVYMGTESRRISRPY